MFAFLLLIGIWLLLNIGVKTIGEMIEDTKENQIRGSLLAKLLVLQECFEFGERFV